MREFLFTIFITFCFLTSFAQTNFNIINTPEKIQLGVSAKGIIEFQKWTPNFRIGLSAGCGYVTLKNIFPTVNVEYSASYGGLGTYYDGNKKNWSSNMVLAGTLTVGTNNEFVNNDYFFIQNRNQPLYYFTDLTQPSLQNPFNCSLSLGTNLIYHLNKCIQYKLQQVGFFDLKFSNFQLGYFNDGGTGMKNFLGDAKDRYYTGGGFININLPLNHDVDNLNISFYRYTGYNKKSFELANELLYGYVDYADKQQNFFNKGFWNFGVSNTGHWNSFIRFNNVYNVKEVQNLIHYLIACSYHQNQSPFFISAGGSYFMSNYYTTKK